MDANKDKIRRFTSDKFSFNDYMSVSSWFKKDEFNDQLIQYMNEDWQDTEGIRQNPQRLSQLLDRLHHHINLNDNKKETLLQRYYRIFSKIAVVLILPALVTIAALSYWSVNPIQDRNSWAEIYSPVGSRTKFQLPDGTQGWLNSGSSIKYPVSFLEHRNVEVSGEAWFDVVHLNSSEFKVMTPFFDVKVLGTQFNVNAYEDEATAGVILERGKVVVLGKDRRVEGELAPNQQIVFNKSTKKILKSDIAASNYTSWKDGLLIFKNEPMWLIARRLERKYNTEIVLHGDSLKSSIFRATFQDENLDEICKMLSIVAPIEYKIHKREKQSDNTFTKSKVDIWLKNNGIKN